MRDSILYSPAMNYKNLNYEIETANPVRPNLTAFNYEL